jgi:hypothetical protein
MLDAAALADFGAVPAAEIAFGDDPDNAPAFKHY